jgi:hypothetical protein
MVESVLVAVNASESDQQHGTGTINANVGWWKDFIDGLKYQNTYSKISRRGGTNAVQKIKN